MNNLNIYVFSFNRGEFLENTLQSLQRCAASYSITVVDDASTDKFTLAVLDAFRNKVKVVTPKLEQDPAHPLGGLYNNMRYAFADARERKIPYALFIQDDMQLVRPITPHDIESAEAFFASNPNSAQLHTCFMKRFYQELDQQQMVEDPSGRAYLRPSSYPGYSGYSDVGLFHVERFFTLFGDLRNKEYDNNAFAQQNGIQMGISIAPFMMWLPFPKSYRGKGRNFQLRLVEWLGGGGFFPYEQMNNEEIENLLKRSTNLKPHAEAWLNCPPLKKFPVWSFAGGLSHLKARGGWRSLLAEFLTNIKRNLKNKSVQPPVNRPVAKTHSVPPVEP